MTATPSLVPAEISYFMLSLYVKFPYGGWESQGDTEGIGDPPRFLVGERSVPVFSQAPRHSCRATTAKALPLRWAQSRAGVRVKRLCSSLLQGNVGEQKQGMCSEEVAAQRDGSTQLRSSRACSSPSPAPGSCLAHSTGRKPLQAAAASVCSSCCEQAQLPWGHLPGTVYPPIPSLGVWWQQLAMARSILLQLAPLRAGLGPGKLSDPCQLQLVWGSPKIRLFAGSAADLLFPENYSSLGNRVNHLQYDGLACPMIVHSSGSFGRASPCVLSVTRRQ